MPEANYSILNQFPIRIISLEHRDDRRKVLIEHMKNHQILPDSVELKNQDYSIATLNKLLKTLETKGIDIQFVPAVNGKTQFLQPGAATHDTPKWLPTAEALQDKTFQSVLGFVKGGPSIGSTLSSDWLNKASRLGCFLSHEKEINDAAKRSQPTLVLEDDCAWIDDSEIAAQLQDSLASILQAKEWDMYYLAASLMMKDNGCFPIEINKTTLQLGPTLSNQAVIYHPKAAAKIAKKMQLATEHTQSYRVTTPFGATFEYGGLQANDTLIYHMQSEGIIKAFAPKRLPATSQVSYSDNLGFTPDYDDALAPGLELVALTAQQSKVLQQKYTSIVAVFDAAIYRECHSTLAQQAHSSVYREKPSLPISDLFKEFTQALHALRLVKNLSDSHHSAFDQIDMLFTKYNVPLEAEPISPQYGVSQKKPAAQVASAPQSTAHRLTHF